MLNYKSCCNILQQYIAYAWFLEIISSANIGIYVYVCMCMCMSLFLYMTPAIDKLNGCGLSNTAHSERLPKKTKVTQY